MKKIALMVAGLLLILFTGCEDFLDTENLTDKNTANYPATLAEAKQMVTGVYNSLSLVNANPQKSFLFVSELASDDRLGGAGTNDQLCQAIDLMMTSGMDMLDNFWTDRYAGVQRANTAIAKLDNCTQYDSEEQKNQFLGEAYFLRGFYYYELASLFENIPVPTEPLAISTPQSDPNVTWGQIISDLKQAIQLMPAKKTASKEAGHVDKYVAEAMMARAFLFYTGFYQQADVTLPDGSTVTKADVIGWIDDCVTNSGYVLVPDFRNLWAYTNRLTVGEYTYTSDGSGAVKNGIDSQPLRYVEDDQSINPESMFAIKYSKFAGWDTTIGYSNGYALFFGIRGGQPQEQTFPFGQGWGAGPVTPSLWNAWDTAEPTDLRRAASICDIRAELDPRGYVKGAAGWADFEQETDYWSKKWTPVSSKKSDGSGYWETFEQDMYDYTSQNFQLTNIHDLILIRFADVLLMQSELKEDAIGLNKVRARAGLPSIPYSLQALQNERRWELAFEGIRWNDIRRWHIAETELTKQENVKIYRSGIVDVNKPHEGGYAARYKSTHGGFFPIPESEIALSDGGLKQNAGWENTTPLYTAW
ncbi:MAG: RagB/SusD family nutrient uptake outer membrane protein [Candidatus Symbiothrix sp.]|nr:RagB/SusD family nutrient uptake outer membrane protein [Candidatus Symbiothrix sp.]